MRATFVYANPRAELAAQVAAGEAPDTGLLGQNHLSEFGVETAVHEPALRRRTRLGGVRHRLTWTLRELTLPWELRDADVAVTPLANLFPLAARVRGRPHVVLLSYGLLTTWRRASRPRRRLLRAALDRAAAVVCLGTAPRTALLGETGLAPELARVVEIGADARYFRPEGTPADGYVLAVGKDLARDYATLARATAGLRCRVLIVAEPRNLVGVDLPPNVEVLRGLRWTELRELYAGASCVALPLRHPEHPFGTEASGLTALVEAMAMAKAVVATERDVFADYVRPGESYVAVPPEDAPALRDALEATLADAKLRHRLGARARALVEERFTTRHLAERLAAVIRDVAA